MVSGASAPRSRLPLPPRVADRSAVASPVDPVDPVDPVARRRARSRARAVLGLGRASLLLVVLLAARPGWAHRIDVQVRGPLALVEVDRPLAFGAEVGRAPSDELVVDLDLPDGAQLVSAAVRGPAGALDLDARGGRAAEYRAALDLQGWRAARVAADEGADLRLRVAAAGLGEGAAAAAWSLRYRFLAPLDCRAGRLVLAMPASLDPSPAAAKVALRVRTGGPPIAELQIGSFLRPIGGGRSAASARAAGVATAAAWEIGVGLGRSGRSGGAGYALAAAVRGGAGAQVLAVGLCRPLSSPRPTVPAVAPTPRRLVLLLDRSLSVGPAGVAAARDLGRALIEALPPSITFNVLLFDQAVEPLFPAARSATREALRDLDDALALGTLRNGTRPALALARAAALETSASGAASGPAYWVMVTDGALPDDQTAEALVQPLRRIDRGAVEAAVVVVREEEEEAPTAQAWRALAAVPGQLGGLVRGLSAREAPGAAAALVEALGAGGDLVDPRITGPAALEAASFDRPAVPPGGGARLLASVRGLPERVRLRARLGGAPVALSAAVVPIERAWVAALTRALPVSERKEPAPVGPGPIPVPARAAGPPGATRPSPATGEPGGPTETGTSASLPSPGGAAPSQQPARPGSAAPPRTPPSPPPPSPSSPEPPPAAPPPPWEAAGPRAAAQLAAVVPALDPWLPRGGMDRDVVHRALAYAYLPRARACYLTRAVKSASDFQLRGRLRLELHLERGEMMAAVVRQSSLGRPEIERCLRDAAYALQVPRAMRNDAPVVAVLNLVFRPRTEASTAPDASALSDEVDRILGPLPPTSGDPLELLVEPPPSTP